MSNYLQRIQDIQSRASSARRQVESLEAGLGGQRATEALQAQEKGQVKKQDYLDTIKDHIENYQARFQDVMGLGSGVAGTAKALKKYRLATLKDQVAAARRKGVQNPEKESGTGQSEGTRPQPDRNPADRADSSALGETQEGIELQDLSSARPPEETTEEVTDPLLQRRDDLRARYENLPEQSQDSVRSELTEQVTNPETFTGMPDAARAQLKQNLDRAEPKIKAAETTDGTTPPIQDNPVAPRPDANSVSGSAADSGVSEASQQAARQGASQTAAEFGTEGAAELGAEAGLSAIPVIGEIAMVVGGIADLIQGVTGENALDDAKKKLAAQPAIQNIQQSGVVTSGFDASALTK